MESNGEVEARNRAVHIAGLMDDRQLAAQVIISGIDGKEHLTPAMRELLAGCPAGGIMLFRYNVAAGTSAVQTLIAECASITTTGTSELRITEAEIPFSGIPPFAAIDHEGGQVNRFSHGFAALPSAGSYWERAQTEGREKALALIEEDSRRAGFEINSIGINLNFAPVAEFLSAENRDFLEGRSYGPQPFFATEAAAAFIRGMSAAGVTCVVKHFPGSAGADPHRFPSVILGGKEMLDGLTAPFSSLVSRGLARAIMVSHSAVPALDTNIASLSPVVLEDWLRGEMGFGGIIISDDFSMAAADNPVKNKRLRPEDAAVLSLAAGADMVLVWPPDLRKTHRAIQSALAEGRIPRERLLTAVQRIVFEKIRMGMLNVKNGSF